MFALIASEQKGTQNGTTLTPPVPEVNVMASRLERDLYYCSSAWRPSKHGFLPTPSRVRHIESMQSCGCEEQWPANPGHSERWTTERP